MTRCCIVSAAKAKVTADACTVLVPATSITCTPLRSSALRWILTYVRFKNVGGNPRVQCQISTQVDGVGVPPAVAGVGLFAVSLQGSSGSCEERRCSLHTSLHRRSQLQARAPERMPLPSLTRVTAHIKPATHGYTSCDTSLNPQKSPLAAGSQRGKWKI